jgi:hypothetical protein
MGACGYRLLSGHFHQLTCHGVSRPADESDTGQPFGVGPYRSQTGRENAADPASLALHDRFGRAFAAGAVGSTLRRMPHIATGVALSLVGGALLGNGFFQGVYAIVQWAKQSDFGGSGPGASGLLAGAGLALLLVGLRFVREGLGRESNRV